MTGRASAGATSTLSGTPEHPVGEDDAGRAMRADARRNYERLVNAARDVFAKYGGGAPMEAIAKEAGVGVGTLYRHFPKRIDIVQAVYQTDVERLVTTAQTVVVEQEPWPALVAWLKAFVDYSQSKRVLLTELHEAFEKDPQLKAVSRERIEHALSIVLSGAQKAGAARDDVSTNDVMQLIGSMCLSKTLTEGQADRLLAMVIDGLRAKP